MLEKKTHKTYYVHIPHFPKIALLVRPSLPLSQTCSFNKLIAEGLSEVDRMEAEL